MKYLHGFSRTEQNRLIHQAKFLEPWIYDGVELKNCRRLLEVGSGVGAQTKILLKRFPKLHIDSVDFSIEQLAVARVLLKTDIGRRVELHHQNAMKLSLDEKFDAAFLCWFLEHVPDPLQVLKQVRKHLRPRAKVYCTEVFNQTLFFEPYSPAFLKYWAEFNDLQWSIKGHPFVGGQLGHLLKKAGFRNIDVEFRPLHFDSRNKVLRNQFIDYFYNILLSAAPRLLETKRVTPALIRKMNAELKKAKARDEGVFFYGFARGVAEV